MLGRGRENAGVSLSLYDKSDIPLSLLVKFLGTDSTL